MAIQFLKKNNAMDSFVATDQRIRSNRRQDEQDQRVRDQDAEKQGVDAAIRESFQTPPAVAPAPPPVAATSSPMPQTTADFRASGQGEGPELPPMPAAPKPAIAEIAARPDAPAATPAAQPNPRRTLQERLASVRGGGATLLKMHETDQANQRTQEREFGRQFFQAIEKGSLHTARTLNQQYKLGFPEEMFANKDFLIQLGVGTSLSRNVMGRVEPEFIKGYSDSVRAGKPYEQAIQDGIAAANGAADKKVSKWVTGPDGNVTGLTATGKSVPTNVRQYIRPVGASNGAGAAPKTGQTERIIERIMDEARRAGKPITYAQALAQSKKAPTDSAETLRRETLALNAAKEDRAYRSDPAGTLNKWRKYYGIDSTAAPASAASGSPAPGKRIKFDAAGNQVS